MVYSLSGGIPVKIVLVEFSKEQRHALVTLQQLIAEKYLPFCYDDESHAALPELGKDYSSVYGYAQTHETLELWLGIWKAHDANVRLNGIPPAARKESVPSGPPLAGNPKSVRRLRNGASCT